MPSFMTNVDRIVGGQDAPSPIPWQVSVQTGYWHFCGATILDESTLLSAAHCFYESSAWDKSIRAGSVENGSGGQVSPSISTIIIFSFTYCIHIRKQKHVLIINTPCYLLNSNSISNMAY